MQNEFQYHGRRTSFMEIGEPYFWTSTIKDWENLLKEDNLKWILIDSLKWLCNKELIKVYGFVIMPNHIHLLWEQLGMNGQEYPKNSFQKFTAHKFLEILNKKDEIRLKKFISGADDRNHLFWQRDPLAIPVISREMAWQKLEYMHNNPLQEHWNLCDNQLLYPFSSAGYYETGKDEFGILTHFMDRF